MGGMGDMFKKRIRTTALVVVISSLTFISIRSIYTDYTIRHRKPAYYIEYEIQPGDCVDMIAWKYKPSYMRLDNFRTEIQVLNNVDTMIYPGTELRIPIYK